MWRYSIVFHDLFLNDAVDLGTIEVEAFFKDQVADKGPYRWDGKEKEREEGFSFLITDCHLTIWHEQSWRSFK